MDIIEEKGTKNKVLGKRLRPLFLILANERISLSELARRVGVSKQTMSTRFSESDNCRLSDMEKMADAIGYEFVYSLQKRADSNTPDTSGHKLPFSPGIANGERLRPFILAMLDNQISLTELARRECITRSSMSTRFSVDDCTLSTAEKMADALGYDFTWQLTKKPAAA